MRKRKRPLHGERHNLARFAKLYQEFLFVQKAVRRPARSQKSIH